VVIGQQTTNSVCHGNWRIGVDSVQMTDQNLIVLALPFTKAAGVFIACVFAWNTRCGAVVGWTRREAWLGQNTGFLVDTLAGVITALGVARCRWVVLGTALWACYSGGMARKKTIQPEPLYRLVLTDGTIAEVRDFITREIGRGTDKKFLSEELDNQVLLGIFDDLLSSDTSRIQRARAAVLSDHAMSRHLLNGGYEMDERTARRHGKSIRKQYQVWVKLVEKHNPALIGTFCALPSE